MQSRAIITWAIILAAFLAGALLYLLQTRAPAAPSPTPSPAVQLSQPTPTPAVEAIITLEPTPAPTPAQMPATAPTGASPWIILLAATAAAAGISGLALHRRLFSL